MMSVTDRPSTYPDRGVRRLMATVGILMMAAPTAELVVQLHYQERPHILLLGGMFLVGLLALSHGLSRRPEPRPRQQAANGDTPPATA